LILLSLPPVPRDGEAINNQSSLSSLPLQSLSAYAMLPPLMPHCCHPRRTAATLPNKLLLLPKLRFCQAAAFAAKLATVAVLPPPLPPPQRCHCRTTAAYKIKEKHVTLLTNLFFTMMVTAASSNNGGSTRQG
jgi:hypothetical protein